MGFLTEKTVVRGTKALTVTGYEGEVADLAVPPLLDGLPVLAIGRSAFAGRRDLKRVMLPRGLKTLGLFAFQNCSNVRELSLSNTTDDYYDGVIRGMESLRRIRVRMDVPDSLVIVREMLRDVDTRLSFALEEEAGEVRLTFPEYVSEAREDTFARAIHFSIEGAGMAYRECVTKKAVDFAGYDRVFDRLTEADFADAVQIAADRLFTPRSLETAAAERYRGFLHDNAVRALLILLQTGDMEALAFLASDPCFDAEALAEALPEAKENPEASAILLEAIAKKRRGAEDMSLRFELEDW